MKNIQIIDAHHHLWKYNNTDYTWMNVDMQILHRDYLPEILIKETEVTGVSGTVVVQARQTIEETQWLLELADQYEFIKGVVGWIDLCSEKCEEQLNLFACNSKLVGVRHVLHDEEDDQFMLRPDFLKGIELLAGFDLAYDLLLFPKHLKNATMLVSKFPNQRFVLDHISKPPIKIGEIQPWKDDILSLASNENVWCKVSGMVTEADVKKWKYEDFVPYMESVLEAFDTKRLMIGSDWPVCLLAGTYNEVMNIPVRFFASLNNLDQRKIFYQNCIECYKLNLN